MLSDGVYCLLVLLYSGFSLALYKYTQLHKFFLLSVMAEFLSFYSFPGPYHSPVPTGILSFFRRWHYSSGFWFLSDGVYLTYCCVCTPVQGQGRCWFSPWGDWVPMDQWDDPWVNHSQRLVGWVPEHCQQEMHSSMPFDSLIWLFPDHPCPSHKGPSPLVPSQWARHSLLSLTPGKGLPLLDSSALSIMAMWKFLLQSTLNQTYFLFCFWGFFVPMVCWNLLLGSLDFCKFFLIHSYPPRTVLSKFFSDCSKRVWGSFAGSSAHNKVWLQGWARLLLGPLADGAHSHSAFVQGWMSNSLFKKGDKRHYDPGFLR